MNILPLSIALRYLRSPHQDSTTHFMVRVCFLGICIGTFSLMMTLIIMHGFERAIHEKMQGINADITLMPRAAPLESEKVFATLQQSFSSRIAGATARAARHVIIEQNGTQTLLFLQGVDPKHEAMVSTLERHISISTTPDASTHPMNPTLATTLAHDNTIILGSKAATALGIHPGSKITLYVPEPTQGKKIHLRKAKVTVTAVVTIGLDEYDQHGALCSLGTLGDIFEEPITAESIAIKAAQNRGAWWQRDPIPALLHDLRNAFPELTVTTWQELYPPLVSSLKLEKYVMFCIVALITLVASLNMISLLVLQLQQKRRDIALMLTLGMLPSTVRSIFVWTGMLITLGASCCGLVLATILGLVLERYPFIRLPDVYYVSHLPARVEISLVLVVFLVTLLIGLGATILPTRMLHKLSIAKTLRSE